MLEKLKKVNLNIILMIALVVIVMLYLKQCSSKSNLNDELKISNMNQAALLDSVTTYKTKSGALVHEKSALIASGKELKNLNKELYDEVEDLNNNPKIVIKTVTKIVHDTITLNTEVIKYADGSTGLKWSHDTTFTGDSLNYQKLAGETKFKLLGDSIDILGTKITTNEIGMSFTTGLNEGKDSYEIFIKSNYPGFIATKVDGAIIDKSMVTSDESSFVVGPAVGYGAVFNPSGQVSHGFTVGVVVVYNLNKPIKKLFKPFGL